MWTRERPLFFALKIFGICLEFWAWDDVLCFINYCVYNFIQPKLQKLNIFTKSLLSKEGNRF